MQGIINTASSTFAAQLGFHWSDLLAYLATNLELVIGSALGFFETLLPDIIVLVLVGAFIYFVYRAFRFFRH